ncbi:hypothetical protein ACN077_20795 [Clostridium chromiireducens]|uniref:hypothetical protein n=1 Tax=Clostridium chromiireducens TaxID=225345 RepID=UPI003AF7059C
MKKNKLRNILVISLAMTGVLQLGQEISAQAVTTVTGVGPGSPGQVVVDSSGKVIKDDRPGVDEATINEENKYRLGLLHGKGYYSNPEKESYYQTMSNGAHYNMQSCFRFTNSQGKPYTGMYKDTGTSVWYVLDENGFNYIGSDPSNQRPFAWKDGKLYTDEIRCLLASSNVNFDVDGNIYVCRRVDLEGATAVEVYVNEWIPMYGSSEGEIWYRSNDKGICYKNQWFHDTDGKWYYFDKNGWMVRNATVNGYWIGADGVWRG